MRRQQVYLQCWQWRAILRLGGLLPPLLDFVYFAGVSACIWTFSRLCALVAMPEQADLHRPGVAPSVCSPAPGHSQGSRLQLPAPKEDVSPRDGWLPSDDIQRIASGEGAISKSFTESIYGRFAESFWQLAAQISLLLNCDVWQYQFLYLHWLATYAVHNIVSGE
ncbi:uncharacterized protein LOC132797869 [Drosophila nasuta]|uniref:uncharacterized protein LOC132797869 n=1 Tax=Drosophila nasuta TaxID=42062 RepID=UPI00295E3B76|nr:uncharacterized protein LOC132797869 [Drosophila nasuta]